MQVGKISVQKTLPLIRAKLLSDNGGEFASWSAKLASKPNFDKTKVKKYDSYQSMPDPIKTLYDRIFIDDDEDEADISADCSVYPPESERIIKTAGLNDTVAIWVFGGVEVIKAFPALDMMQELVDKTLKDEGSTRHIYFRAEGSVFVDGFPHSLVSNYEVLSKTGQRVDIPAPNGGRAKSMKLSPNKWVVVFTKTCGDKTLAKLVKMLTGKNINDIDIKDEMKKMMKNLMKGKKLEKLLSKIMDLDKEPEPPSEEIQDAFDSIE